MKFYRKQPLEAEQFDGSQKLVFGYSVIPSGLIDAITEKPAYYSMLVDDVCQDSDDDTGVVLEAGDWVVKEADDIEVIADDVFEKTYAELPVIPYYVNDYINHMKLSYRDIWDAMHYPFRSDKMDKYMEDNSETFARAWLDGYQVEEDK